MNQLASKLAGSVRQAKVQNEQQVVEKSETKPAAKARVKIKEAPISFLSVRRVWPD